MKEMQIFQVFIILMLSCFVYGQEKIVQATKPLDEKCLELIKSKNTSTLNRCHFFKCFEERFPCGNHFWIMNWGYKYCRRYADPEFSSKFTKTGKKLLSHINKCLPKSLEKYYKTKKAIHCKRLTTQAFEAQGKCYQEVQKDFCVGFPENKDLFTKVLDQQDFFNMESISMIRATAEKCRPKIDLQALMFGNNDD